MEGELIRDPTADEKKDFIDISYKDSTSAEIKFKSQMADEEQIALKKGLPFATNIAINDFKDYYESEVKKAVRKFGYIPKGEIKLFKPDWKKYSDLKNFELINEGEMSDAYLSKNNPGLDVKISWKKYKFKGYNYIYQMMEDSPSAIQKARKKLKELEK